MKGRFYAVTGAGSGIGRATTIRLAELGAAGVAISDVDEKGLEETKRLGELRLSSPGAKVLNTTSQWIRDQNPDRQSRRARC